jgi:phosphoribosyl 1,2-cyclic phosphodiesterase
MRFSVLGSGSKGNATLVTSGRTALLIDNGFSGRETRRRLAGIGFDPADLTAILVTHEHGDHVRGVAILSRQAGVPVHANQATFRAAGAALERPAAYREFETGTPFTIQDMRIHPFAVSHDTAEPVGFVVTDGRATLGYCTDTGMVSRLMEQRLGGCHGLVLECNHDPELLARSHYPIHLKQRVRSRHGHLANQEAAAFLAGLMHRDLQHVALAHLSEVNNRPEIARLTVEKALDGLPERPEEFRLSVACQDTPGDWVGL